MLRNYYDMCIKINDTTDKENIKNIIKRAKLLQLKGLMLFIPFTPPATAYKYKQDIEKFMKENNIQGIDIYIATLLPHSSITSQLLADFRKKGIATAVEGEEIRNVIQKGVDILIPSNFPLLIKQFNQVVSSLLHSSLTSLLIPLQTFFNLPRHQQILSLNALRLVYKLNEKHPFPLLVGSGAREPQEMRSGRDLASFSYIINSHIEQALKTTSTYPEILLKKIKILSNPARKQPGVYEVKNEKDKKPSKK